MATSEHQFNQTFSDLMVRFSELTPHAQGVVEGYCGGALREFRAAVEIMETLDAEKRCKPSPEARGALRVVK